MADPNADVTKLGNATKPQMAKSQKSVDKMGNEIEGVLIDLEDILGREFPSYAPSFAPDGKSSGNIDKLDEMLVEVRTLIDSALTNPGSPGIELIEKWNTHLVGLGIERLQVELDEAVRLKLFNAEKFKAAFNNFGTAESGSVRFGRKYWLSNYDYHGDNIVDFFVRTTEQALIDGIPSVGSGDTLAKRLLKSKDGKFRLNDMTVTDKNGVRRLVTAENRADMMARTEIARIESQAFHSKAAEVGLDFVMTLNPSPVAPQCVRAVRLGVVRREELLREEGLSPRHPRCESREIAMAPGWNA